MNFSMETVEQKVSALLAPFLQEVEKDLNKWSVAQKTEKDLTTQQEIIVHPKMNAVPLSITQVPMSDDEFALQDIVAGSIVLEKTQKSDVNQIIVRAAIGYALLSRIASEEETIDALKPTIKKMLNDLQQAKGFGPDKLNSGIYGCFEKFNNKSSYLNDLSNYAAMELRLYSNSVLCE